MARFLRTLHRDQRGAVSLETILIIGAVALPLLIWIIKAGWPRIRGLFMNGLENIEYEREEMYRP